MTNNDIKSSNNIPCETEDKLFNAIMHISEKIQNQLCKKDEDWQLIQRLMRLDSGISVYYNCKENNLPYNIDDFVYEFDLEID